MAEMINGLQGEPTVIILFNIDNKKIYFLIHNCMTYLSVLIKEDYLKKWTMNKTETNKCAKGRE